MKRTAAFSAALIVALIVLFAWRLRHGDHDHEEFQANLWRARHVDANFNEDLLRARFSLLESYDDFERYLREMESIAAALRTPPRFIDQAGRAAIRQAADRLGASFRERRRLFERFKSGNALLANSSRYFPEGANELVHDLGDAPADQELIRIIQKLTGALLANASSTGELNFDAARGVAQMRDWMRRNGGHAQSAFVSSLIQHAQQLVVGKDALDALTRQLLALPTTTGIERLSHSYEIELAAALNRAHIYRTLLYALAGSLVAVVGYALWAQRDANRTLERRVEERTRALQVEIGERRRSEAALRESQEETARERSRLAFIFDTVPVGFAWMRGDDLSTRIVNAAHTRITGVGVHQAGVLANYRDATHPEDRAKQDAFHHQLRAGAINHYEIEKRYVHTDGAVRWAALTVRLHRDPATGLDQEVNTLVDITDRKLAEARLAETHRQLLDTSRQAGMAEVATGVLHNVGNVLNSVNVSATLVADQIRSSKSAGVTKLASLIHEHAADLAGFLTRDPRGCQVPEYLQTLAGRLAGEQSSVLREVETLRKNIGHIREIVSMQQSYAKVSGVREQVLVTELVEDALRLNAGGLARHQVTLARDFLAEPIIVVEKHKVLQILVNLVRNAKHACDDSGQKEKRITVRVALDAAHVNITVSDNGIGIPAENLTRIFGHGFTTRKNGHGFGLHSGALAAKELGGRLTARSDGLGCGASFDLTLPLQPVANTRPNFNPIAAACDETVTSPASGQAMLIPV